MEDPRNNPQPRPESPDDSDAQQQEIDALLAAELPLPASAAPPSFETSAHAKSVGASDPDPEAEQPVATPGADDGPNDVSAAAPPTHPYDLPEFTLGDGSQTQAKRISMLNDVKLNVKIELGRTRMLVEDVLAMGEGSVVELDKPAGDPVEVYANERLVARGEVLVLNDNFCVRISEVLEADPHRVSA